MALDCVYSSCRLRIKDVDFATNQITIRSGKGGKDRSTMLPVAIKLDLTAHIERVRQQHEADLRSGAGWVKLGHRDMHTTMIYTHVLNRGPSRVRGPADRMFLS